MLSCALKFLYKLKAFISFCYISSNFCFIVIRGWFWWLHWSRRQLNLLLCFIFSRLFTVALNLILSSAVAFADNHCNRCIGCCQRVIVKQFPLKPHLRIKINELKCGKQKLVVMQCQKKIPLLTFREAYMLLLYVSVLSPILVHWLDPLQHQLQHEPIHH